MWLWHINIAFLFAHSQKGDVRMKPIITLREREIVGDKAICGKEITMKTVYFLAGGLLTILIAGCATIKGSGDVTQGRQALLAGEYQRALGFFPGARRGRTTLVDGSGVKVGVVVLFGSTR